MKTTKIMAHKKFQKGKIDPTNLWLLCGAYGTGRVLRHL